MAKQANADKPTVEVGFSTEVREAIALFDEAKALAKRAEELKAEAEAILREALGNATVATVGGVKAFSLEHRTRVSLDQKRLEQEHKAIFDEFARVTEYDFIKTV
jgi:prolyl-tRNA editing enzyme YbaK/EbsC (Cys-tRNA(Pro) deacylase)